VRILILSQYFTPEITAARARVHPIARDLAERGHQVEVLCEVPNHPAGIVREGYRHRPLVRREIDGFAVSYVWVRASPRKNTRNRLLFYGTYALSATLKGFAGRRPDVVLVSSPPLPAAAAAAAIAVRHRAPLVMDVRDPWPEAAVALGELTNARAIAALERLERRLYARASAIVTVTEPFRADIAAKVDDPAKIEVIPNGTTRAWLRAGTVTADRAQLGMPEDRFVLTYAGNLGLAQGLEPVLEAAAALGDGFQLQLVGEGPLREKLEEIAGRLPAGRVAFRGLVEPEQAMRLLRASDATLVPLGARPELRKFVPSKLFDCCAIGRPTILSAAGEPQRLAGEAGAAMSIPPEDSAALIEAVRRLRDDPILAEDLAERGRRFAATYVREEQVEKLEGILLEAARHP
jgi:glycosyltransferase involved in cell wall biosynthesis